VNPRFLSKENVLRLHEKVVNLYGGSHGVRDEGLLESALAQPETGFGEECAHKDFFGMAAAYLYHLVQNHAFHDGNKRIGLAAAAVFLDLNGLEVTASSEAFEELVLSTARSEKKKPEIVEFFRKNCASLQP
jgi:death on curing protein